MEDSIDLDGHRSAELSKPPRIFSFHLWVAQSLGHMLGLASSAPQDDRRKRFCMNTEDKVESKVSSVVGHPSSEEQRVPPSERRRLNWGPQVQG